MIKVIQTKEELTVIISSLDRKKLKVGFVPTMGYFHRGHISLVEKAQLMSDIVVVSIFVNPSQFGANEDFNHYPRNLQRDLEQLQSFDPLYVFNPPNEEMYPAGHKTWITVSDLDKKLCGTSRPNHFRGVATVVAKLINIVNPDMMFMGEKDFQQLMIIKKMITDLNFRTKVVSCPIVREDSGLAMSSRNKYLSDEERANAASIYQSLQLARQLFAKGVTNSEQIIFAMKKLIANSGGSIDYIEIIDSDTVEKKESLEKGSRILVAAYFGKTRLIDNVAVTI